MRSNATLRCRREAPLRAVAAVQEVEPRVLPATRVVERSPSTMQENGQAHPKV